MCLNKKMKKHCIIVDQNLVSYHVWGNSGPVVLALHGSPQSARAIAHVCEMIAAQGFVVIAPDTPGNGRSDPLVSSEKTTIADYAAALYSFTESLGISNHGIYGFHTGAAIACVYAAIYPHKTNSIFFDGLPNWSLEEQESLIGYMKDFEPSWEGAHMSWLWARMEEQTVFFPWNHAMSSFRMDYDVALPASCHANVMDLLQAKGNYIQPYREALKFNPANWLALLQAPYICAANNGDPLKEHLTRPGFEDITPYVYHTLDEMYQTAIGLFNKNKTDPITLTKPVALAGSCVDFPNNEQIFWHGTLHHLKTNNPSLVFLHGSGDSSDIYARLAKYLSLYTRVISFDLPGHGYSHNSSSLERHSVESLAHSYHDACSQLGISNYVVIGQRLGGLIASDMLRQKYIKQAICIDTQDQLSEENWQALENMNYSLSPEWDGTHLIRAWRIARWGVLFRPWFTRDKDHATHTEGAQLDPLNIQVKAKSLLMANDEWIKAMRLESQGDVDIASLPAIIKYTSYPCSDRESLRISECKDNWFKTLIELLELAT
jgi:pimeloyl-ACP methyl ester carboxylesterase